MQVADQFMLDHLMQMCECLLQVHHPPCMMYELALLNFALTLQSAVCEETVDVLMEHAEAVNALQLQAVCAHFKRNQGGSGL